MIFRAIVQIFYDDLCIQEGRSFAGICLQVEKIPNEIMITLYISVPCLKEKLTISSLAQLYLNPITLSNDFHKILKRKDFFSVLTIFAF